MSKAKSSQSSGIKSASLDGWHHFDKEDFADADHAEAWEQAIDDLERGFATGIYRFLLLGKPITPKISLALAKLLFGPCPETGLPLSGTFNGTTPGGAMGYYMQVRVLRPKKRPPDPDRWQKVQIAGL